MQARCLGLGSPGGFGDPEESSGPKALVATQAEAVSQLAWGRERGVLLVQKGHIPHMDSPPLFSLRPLGKCDA